MPAHRLELDPYCGTGQSCWQTPPAGIPLLLIEILHIAQITLIQFHLSSPPGGHMLSPGWER